LAAACDLKAERAQSFCRKYGFMNAYRDVDEMLARQKLDGCIAVVPVERISQLGIKLLGLGIPCVVEKPLGASLTEVKALLDAARATRTPNMVSVNRRFMPFLNRAIEWTRTVGPLRYVRCTLTRHARNEPDFLWTFGPLRGCTAYRWSGGRGKDPSPKRCKRGSRMVWDRSSLREWRLRTH
jgi:predicted dehydrogenase